MIKEDFGNSSDVMIRSFKMLEHHSVRATVVYLDGLVDERMVDEFIDKCLQAELLEEINEEELYEYIKERARSISKAKTISSMDNVYEALLSGDSVIFVDGISHAVQGSTNGGDRAGNILEGRVGIFVDGTPFNLVVPVTIAQFLQASEDYTQPYHFTTLIRMLRYFSFFISLLSPSIYSGCHVSPKRHPNTIGD